METPAPLAPAHAIAIIAGGLLDMDIVRHRLRANPDALEAWMTAIEEQHRLVAVELGQAIAAEEMAEQERMG